MKICPVFFAILSSLFATSVAAECRLEYVRIDQAEASVSPMRFDSFSLQAQTETFIVEVERIDDGVQIINTPAVTSPDSTAVPSINGADTDQALECSGRIQVSANSASRFIGSSDSIQFDLLSAGTLSQGSGNRITRQFRDLQPNERVRLAYRMILASSQPVAAGRYVTTLDVSTVFGDTLIRGGAEISVVVEPAASLSIGGPTGINRIVDFGKLQPGASPVVPVFVSVLANSPYTVTFRSQNNSSLRLRNGGNERTIGYRLSVDNQLLDLRNGNVSRTFSSGTGAISRSMRLDFSITDVGEFRAGTYTDRVTVEVTPSSFIGN